MSFLVNAFSQGDTKLYKPTQLFLKYIQENRQPSMKVDTLELLNKIESHIQTKNAFQSSPNNVKIECNDAALDGQGKILFDRNNVYASLDELITKYDANPNDYIGYDSTSKIYFIVSYRVKYDLPINANKCVIPILFELGYLQLAGTTTASNLMYISKRKYGGKKNKSKKNKSKKNKSKKNKSKKNKSRHNRK